MSWPAGAFQSPSLNSFSVIAVSFYLLWVEPGEDRAMALAAAHRHGKCPADVPICCAEWKAPESFTRRGRILGQRPRSRVTNQRRLSEDEVAVLFEAIDRKSVV